MGIYDRDWYREEFRKKEERYKGDFSVHSKPHSKEAPRKETPQAERAGTTYAQTQKEESPRKETPRSEWAGASYAQTQKRERSNALDIVTILFCPLTAFLTTYFQKSIFNPPILPIQSTIIGLVLFITMIKRRKRGDRSALNALAMISSMLSFAFSLVLTFFIFALRYGWI